MERRQYLLGLATAVATGAAGCTGLGSEDDGPSETGTTEPGSSPTEGGTGEPTDEPTEEPTDEPTEEPTEGDDPTEDPGSTPSEEPAPGLENPSFEDGLAGWEVGKDLPEEPGDSEETVDHGVETVSREASDGDVAVEFYISGVADDGTIWVEQSVDLTDVESVSLDVYSRQESFNIMSQVAFFAGEKPDGGLEEADFDREEEIEDHEGWKTYSYPVDDVAGTVTLAVGMNVRWETEIRRLFDHVRLEGTTES